MDKAKEGRPVNDRLPAEAELAWDSFHQVVNMTSEELRNGPSPKRRGKTATDEHG